MGGSLNWTDGGCLVRGQRGLRPDFGPDSARTGGRGDQHDPGAAPSVRSVAESKLVADFGLMAHLTWARHLLDNREFVLVEGCAQAPIGHWGLCLPPGSPAGCFGFLPHTRGSWMILHVILI